MGEESPLKNYINDSVFLENLINKTSQLTAIFLLAGGDENKPHDDPMVSGTMEVSNNLVMALMDEYLNHDFDEFAPYVTPKTQSLLDGTFISPAILASQKYNDNELIFNSFYKIANRFVKTSDESRMLIFVE